MDLKKAIEEATEFKKSGKNVPWQRIAEEANVSWQALRSKARRFWEEHGTEEQGVSYKVINDYYIWETNYGPVKLSVKDVDDMFFQYSKHGMNKSSTQMIADWNMELWQWHSLKSRLRLYKDANIFSPYTVEITPKQDLMVMIETKMRELYEKSQLMVEKAYTNETLRAAREIIFKDQRKSHITNDILENLEEAITTNGFAVYSANPYSGSFDSDTIVLVIGDLHLGLDTEDVDQEIITKRLNTIVAHATKYKPKNVKVCILGDIIESFTGTTKGDTWQTLSVMGYGANVVMEAVDMLSNFIGGIGSICNNVEVYAIPGNHDRMSNNKDEDPLGQIGMLIYRMCERATPWADWHISPMVDSFEACNKEFIIMHGDKQSSRLQGSEISIVYGKTDKFKYILRAHLHHRQIVEDTSQYRFYTIPSIVGRTPYSDRLGLASLPGFYIFTENSVIDYELE
jgi:UDP-2,3-diacylglucosamine pyrophosphatase LpxH